MISKIKSLFTKDKDKTMSEVHKAIEKYIEMKENNKGKTYVLVEFIRKDDSIDYMVKEVDGHSVKIKDGQNDNNRYYATKDFMKNLEYKKDKQTYRIPKIILFEGITTAYDARKLKKSLRQPGFSEKFQKAMYIDIKAGIMEEQRRKKINLRKWITGGLIAAAAIFIGYNMLVG